MSMRTGTDVNKYPPSATSRTRPAAMPTRRHGTATPACWSAALCRKATASIGVSSPPEPDTRTTSGTSGGAGDHLDHPLCARDAQAQATTRDVEHVAVAQPRRASDTCPVVQDAHIGR